MRSKWNSGFFGGLRREEKGLRWTRCAEKNALVGAVDEIGFRPFEVLGHVEDGRASVDKHAHVVLTGLLDEESQSILHHEFHTFDELLQLRHLVNVIVRFVDVVPV